MVVDFDIYSMYPHTISVILPGVPFWWRHCDKEGKYRFVTGTRKVDEWISETLPNVAEYQGELILDEGEFIMLVLKFGPGAEEDGNV